MDQRRSSGLTPVSACDSDIAARIRSTLNLEITFNDAGRPRLEAAKLPTPKWPSKLEPHRTVVLDTSPSADGEFWPTPRFEILIANLDAVGISAVQVGDASSDRLARATHRFPKLAPAERAAVINKALLWVGLDTHWRIVAAALNKPQIVIAAAGVLVDPRWNDTFVANSSAHVPESKILGPISVTSVAEAVSAALKQLGAASKL
ncbi:MAG: hypothetical protein IPG71_05900 [bacterium]|nr:hypothetical protein [bacterium]